MALFHTGTSCSWNIIIRNDFAIVYSHIYLKMYIDDINKTF